MAPQPYVGIHFVTTQFQKWSPEIRTELVNEGGAREVVGGFESTVQPTTVHQPSGASPADGSAGIPQLDLRNIVVPPQQQEAPPTTTSSSSEWRSPVAAYPSPAARSVEQILGTLPQQPTPDPNQVAAELQNQIGSALQTAPPTVNMPHSVTEFLNEMRVGGIGVLLGVGTNPLYLELLSHWQNSAGLYLVDPFIHVPRGYEGGGNLPDIEHQRIFEDLRNKIHHFENR